MKKKKEKHNSRHKNFDLNRFPRAFRGRDSGSRKRRRGASPQHPGSRRGEERAVAGARGREIELKMSRAERHTRR